MTENCLGKGKAACTHRALSFGNWSIKEKSLLKVDTAVSAQPQKPLERPLSSSCSHDALHPHLSSRLKEGLGTLVTLSPEEANKGPVLRKHKECVSQVRRSPTDQFSQKRPDTQLPPFSAASRRAKGL